jgi:hypothetical protein
VDGDGFSLAQLGGEFPDDYDDGQIRGWGLAVGERARHELKAASRAEVGLPVEFEFGRLLGGPEGDEHINTLVAEAADLAAQPVPAMGSREDSQPAANAGHPEHGREHMDSGLSRKRVLFGKGLQADVLAAGCRMCDVILHRPARGR